MCVKCMRAYVGHKPDPKIMEAFVHGALDTWKGKLDSWPSKLDAWLVGQPWRCS